MAGRRTIPTALTAPTALPLLQRGSHAHPDDGACFMEFASLLAGERFTDRPRCTHPVLAAVARAVNDAVGDRTRQQLVPLIPDVIGVGRDDRRAGPLLVALCTERALSAQEEHRTCFANGCGSPRCAHRQWLRSAHGRACRRLGRLDRQAGAGGGASAARSRRQGVGRLSDRMRLRLYDASAEHVISLAVSVVARSSEQAAVELLRDAVTQMRAPSTARPTAVAEDERVR